MPKNKIIVILAVLIGLQPLLGFPSSWESVFQVLAGFGIVGLSIWGQIDRRLTQKARARERRQAYRRVEDVIQVDDGSSNEEPQV